MPGELLRRHDSIGGAGGGGGRGGGGAGGGGCGFARASSTIFTSSSFSNAMPFHATPRPSSSALSAFPRMLAASGSAQQRGLTAVRTGRRREVASRREVAA
eukprot:scaffold85453_cov54-Phaeocystis_antarctica.AAC.4